jgi:transcriptional regulator with XRE-family HTH domain
MANIREILAQNLKENRRKLGITQPTLAERAGLSTHYLGMIEIGRNFPTSDVLERLAEALCINSNELFSVAGSPERAIEDLQQAVLDNLDHSIEHALDKAFEKRCTGCPSASINSRLPAKENGFKKP